MKRFRILFTIFLLASLSLVSCQKEAIKGETDVTGTWSEKSIATINAVSGDYTIVSATWDSPIDLSGHGTASRDILEQLETYGWLGDQAERKFGEEESTSILYCSTIVKLKSPGTTAEINLYIPSSVWVSDRSFAPYKDGLCNIDMNVYQCKYTVDYFGNITLLYVRDRNVEGLEHFTHRLENVQVYFNGGGYLIFEADATFYDWATASWQDGHMRLAYWHN